MDEMDRAAAPRSILLVGPPEARGLGFRVGDEWIITVGHNLPRTPNHRNPGEDLVLVEVAPFEGNSRAVATPEVFDCILDVAVLGDPGLGEIQVPGHDLGNTSFFDLVAGIDPLPLRERPIALNQHLRVHLSTHEGVWLSGTTKMESPFQYLLTVTFDDPATRVKGGTSGAPVFDDEGEVVGILSRANEDDRPGQATVVYLENVLPRWFLATVRE